MKKEDAGKATNHIHIFEEAGMFPDIQKNFNLIKPQLDILAGTDQNFIWGVDPYFTTTQGKKYERRKLSSIHGNGRKSQS